MWWNVFLVVSTGVAVWGLWVWTVRSQKKKEEKVVEEQQPLLHKPPFDLGWDEYMITEESEYL